MSNLKLSQLPEYTGNTSGSYLVMNNSGETTTFKVKKENYIFPYNGNAAISGSLTTSGSLTVSGSAAGIGNGLNVIGNTQLSGSIIINGSTPSGSKFLYFTTTESSSFSSTGAGIIYTPAAGSGGGTLNILPFVSGSEVQIGSETQLNKNKLVGRTTEITGSLFSTTDSLNFKVAETAPGLSFLILENSVTSSAIISSGSRAAYVTCKSTNNDSIFLTATSGSGVRISDQQNGVEKVILSVGTNISGSNPPVKFARDVEITGSLVVSGSVYITGSVQGNVNSLSIASNTASLNLANGNFYTLQLVSGSNTRIEPSNIAQGQTVNILLSTTGSATVSFPTSVLQVSGSSYVPTTTTSKDIITLVSFDSSSLYLANVKNLA